VGRCPPGYSNTLTGVLDILSTCLIDPANYKRQVQYWTAMIKIVGSHHQIEGCRISIVEEISAQNMTRANIEGKRTSIQIN
jgi:hypothetical protein